MAKVLEPTQEEPTIKGALGRIGLPHATSATIIAHAEANTRATPEQVWAVWSELEKWPSWYKPSVSSVRWLEKRAWEVGAKFEEKIGYGFPFGTVVSIETVKEVNLGQSVSWWKTAKGVRSCHIWFFEPLRDGGTNVAKTLVMVGPQAWFARLFGARKRWNRQFREVVDNLIKAVERTAPAATPTDKVSS